MEPFTLLLSLVFLGLTTWMSWKIMVKAGFPGYLGLFNIAGIIPGIGWLIWIVLLWVFAFIDWPRDAATAPRVAYQPPGGPLPPQGMPPLPPGPAAAQVLPPPAAIPPVSPNPRVIRRNGWLYPTSPLLRYAAHSARETH